MATNVVFLPAERKWVWIYDNEPLRRFDTRSEAEQAREQTLARRARILGHDRVETKPMPDDIVFDRRSEQWYWSFGPEPHLQFFRREAAELYRFDQLRKRAEFMGRELLPDEMGKWDEKSAERRREQEEIDKLIRSYNSE